MIIYDKVQKCDNVGKNFDLSKGVINLKYKEGGSYFSLLPISDLNFRKGDKWLELLFGKKKKSQAKAIIFRNKRGATFYLTDDWGNEHTIFISKKHENLIQKSIKKLQKEELLYDYLGQKSK